jgi:excisionase family DNA binding protein
LTPQYTRLAGASRISCVPQDTLRDAIKAGRLRASRVGTAYYIKISDLHAFMEQHTVTPRTQAV